MWNYKIACKKAKYFGLIILFLVVFVITEFKELNKMYSLTLNFSYIASSGKASFVIADAPNNSKYKNGSSCNPQVRMLIKLIIHIFVMREK